MVPIEIGSIKRRCMTEDRPTRRNSSLALERLRILVDQLAMEGVRQLPTERDLSDQIGVGRRAVRRALEVLETEGFIWRRQGAGTFIGSKPSNDEQQLSKLPEMSNMLEVMEVRLRLEPALAQLAAIRATPQDIVQMRHIADKVGEADDMDGRELWDGALHRAIAKAAGNALFLALFDVVDRTRQNESWRHVREALRTSETVTQYKAQHSEIVDAIERHDPVSAERLMRQHLLTLQERLLFQTSESAGNV